MSHTLPLSRRPSLSGGNAASGGGGIHDQLVITREKCDRLTSENADLSRRVKDKDERVTELQKSLAAAQQRGTKATEQLISEQTERKAIELGQKRAETEKANTAKQLSEAMTRAERAEASAAALQAQCDASNSAAQQTYAALERAQQEARQAAEQAARSDAAVGEMKAELLRRETHEREKLEAVEAQREASRGESSKLAERLAVAQTEARLHQEGLRRLTEAIEGERSNLKSLVLDANERLVLLQQRLREESVARERADGAAEKHLAEKTLLHDLSAKVHEQMLHERAASYAAQTAIDSLRQESQTRVDGLLAELAQACGRPPYSLHRPTPFLCLLSHSLVEGMLAQATARAAAHETERYTQRDTVLRAEADVREHAHARQMAETDRDAALKRAHDVDAALEKERGAVEGLEAERQKSAQLHQQRDAAEEGRLRTQEQLAQTIEKLQSADERRRGAEAAIADARVKLADGGDWEARCRELERERKRMSDAVEAANAEAKAVGDREQVRLLTPSLSLLTPSRTFSHLLAPSRTFSILGLTPACDLAIRCSSIASPCASGSSTWTGRGAVRW